MWITTSFEVVRFSVTVAVVFKSSMCLIYACNYMICHLFRHFKYCGLRFLVQIILIVQGKRLCMFVFWVWRIPKLCLFKYRPSQNVIRFILASQPALGLWQSALGNCLWVSVRHNMLLWCLLASLTLEATRRALDSPTSDNYT